MFVTLSTYLTCMFIVEIESFTWITLYDVIEQDVLCWWWWVGLRSRMIGSECEIKLEL